MQGTLLGPPRLYACRGCLKLVVTTVNLFAPVCRSRSLSRRSSCALLTSQVPWERPMAPSTTVAHLSSFRVRYSPTGPTGSISNCCKFLRIRSFAWGTHSPKSRAAPFLLESCSLFKCLSFSWISSRAWRTPCSTSLCFSLKASLSLNSCSLCAFRRSSSAVTELFSCCCCSLCCSSVWRAAWVLAISSSLDSARASWMLCFFSWFSERSWVIWVKRLLAWATFLLEADTLCCWALIRSWNPEAPSSYSLMASAMDACSCRASSSSRWKPEILLSTRVRASGPTTSRLCTASAILRSSSKICPQAMRASRASRCVRTSSSLLASSILSSKPFSAFSCLRYSLILSCRRSNILSKDALVVFRL
mmetsp:Transcript_30224/g.84444  ORF Transcript_30224/g.84444 Transcript_30224/m.84444 type:complete len:362 (+) Transcript_30224:2319-3404(+)